MRKQGMLPPQAVPAAHTLAGCWMLWQPLGIMVEQTPSSQGRKGEGKSWIRNKHPEAVLDYGSLRQETDPQHFYRGFS